MIKTQHDELYVGGLSANELVDQFGEPIYVYDAEAITRRVAELRANLPSEIEILYSMKSNPNVSIVAFLAALVNGIEVSSLGELYVALEAGVDPRAIIFVGPSKSTEELREAVTRSLNCIVVESDRELEHIDQLSAQCGLTTRVALRINPSFDALGPKLRMGGASRQFGIDEERAEEVVQELQRLPHVLLVGLHAYVGTRILDYKAVCRNTVAILQLASNLALKTGRDLEMIDIGGGLGVPYFPGEPQFDLRRFGEEAGPIFERFRRAMPNTRLIMELGRFLVAECGIYVTRVRYLKSSRGQKYALVSGGMNHLMATASVGSVVKSHFPIEVLNKVRLPKDNQYHICGPLCTPTDVLGKSVDVPELELGDLIGVRNAGAYGLTASPTDFLSHPRPAEVLVVSGTAHLIRRQAQTADVMRDQILVRADLQPIDRD